MNLGTWTDMLVPTRARLKSSFSQTTDHANFLPPEFLFEPKMEKEKMGKEKREKEEKRKKKKETAKAFG